MNNLFNINRFVSYEKRSFPIFGKYLLIITCTIIGLYMLSLLLWFANEWNSSRNAFSAIFPITLVLIVLIPFLVEQETNKNKAVFNYTLPISNFERFISLIIKYVIIIPAICIAILYLVDKISLHIEYDKFINSSGYGNYDTYRGSLNLNNIISPSILLIFGAQSLFLYGYMYFKRNALFKTLLVSALLLYFLPFIASISGKLFTGYNLNLMIFDLLEPWSIVERWVTPSPVIIATDIFFKVLLSVGMWFLLYRKIKEIEI